MKKLYTPSAMRSASRHAAGNTNDRTPINFGEQPDEGEHCEHCGRVVPASDLAMYELVTYISDKKLCPQCWHSADVDCYLARHDGDESLCIQ